jgi:hypothetical protein
LRVIAAGLSSSRHPETERGCSASDAELDTHDTKSLPDDIGGIRSRRKLRGLGGVAAIWGLQMRKSVIALVVTISIGLVAALVAAPIPGHVAPRWAISGEGIDIVGLTNAARALPEPAYPTH